MLENNFQKAKKMISYLYKINMWWMILFNSVNKGNSKTGVELELEELKYL